MQMTGDSSAANTEQLAQARPLVERWLVWSGLAPLPLFLLLHLTLELRRAFANDVSDVVRAERGLLLTLASILLVWLPLSVHLVLGARRLLSGRETANIAEPDVPASTRTLSRISAVVAGVFVLYHARNYTLAVWLHEADARDAGFRLIAEVSSTRFGAPIAGGAYLFGLLATATHTGLAIHRALLTQGFLRTPAQRSASARACAAFAALVFVSGAAAVIRVASGVLLR